ncbi:hypothetical protein MRX96_053058 [Rhipicephalus microplus]
MGTADDAPQGPVIIRQTVFVFPREQFDPNYVRLVTRGRNPATAVACLLGFFKLVCEDGYKEMLRASCLDGNWLDEVDVARVSGAPVRRQLRALSDDSEPRATMDDFYVLLGVLLRNLACVPGHPLGHYWFLKRVAELLKLFPGVSEPPSRAAVQPGAGGRRLQLRPAMAPHQGGPLPRPAREPVRNADITTKVTTAVTAAISTLKSDLNAEIETRFNAIHQTIRETTTSFAVLKSSTEAALADFSVQLAIHRTPSNSRQTPAPTPIT